MNHLVLSLALGVVLFGCGDDATAGPSADAGPRPAYDGHIPGTDAGPPIVPECPADDGTASALVFDGVDDHVAMGVASSLGLATFTVEAWIRRDGDGLDMGTGVGGLRLVPIAGRGRGENDGSNVDCNYAFGLVGEVLGADFEDMASGANHPVMGRTAVTRGEWHHVAVSYDGDRWQLFLDGVLDGEATTGGATPRADSIQHFGIATSFNSTGVPAGFFHGAIDEVRVWNRARTAEEIAGSTFEALSAGDGLAGRWAIDEPEAAAIADSVGANPGTLEGASYALGAALGHGLPAILDGSAPEEAATVGADVDLTVEIADPDGEVFDVKFFARPVDAEDDFTIAVLPDTQNYTDEGRGREHYYHEQTQWIVDNVDDYNIVGVIHNGDIVNNGGLPYQWSVAVAAMERLEDPIGAFMDGIPYGLSVGNHDYDGGARNPVGTVAFNRWFGIDRFQGRAYYGGHFGTTNNEHFVTFSAGGLDFVVVNLSYDTTPDPAVLDWARQVFLSHPESFGVLNTHFLIDGMAVFGAQGRRIYAALADVPNLHLMTCGHISSESRRTDTHEASGHVVTTMLADYQGRANGGNGWMRIWEFSPANDELTVRSYSPSLDRWETDGQSEFTVPVDLSGAGKDFVEVGAADVYADDEGNATASVHVNGLLPGVEYEWYARVDDCFHDSRSPVRTFTTTP